MNYKTNNLNNLLIYYQANNYSLNKQTPMKQKIIITLSLVACTCFGISIGTAIVTTFTNLGLLLVVVGWILVLISLFIENKL